MNPEPTSTTTDEAADEFDDGIDWGGEPEVAAPSCNLEDPELCETCM